MLFNSVEFIFYFLPVTLLIYFLLNRSRWVIVGKIWLVIASLAFYSWWTVQYLPILLLSIFFNYAVGSVLTRKTFPEKRQKLLLVTGLVFNLALLGYFKYMDFFLANVNAVLSTQVPLLHLALPLGISFITFQKIAYLVDAYKGETKNYNFLDYMLFVTFFPQLISGPIVHHKEIMPQFGRNRNRLFSYKNFSAGVFLFGIGLFKKMIIADNLTPLAHYGFDLSKSLSFLEAWLAAYSYTFQLYYDFSGYTDMALGLGLMFNIVLPQNFRSPYKATSIQDFWRRWHMTLSRFLRDYVYIPLGGSRKGEWRTYGNLITTFLLGGLWHGAGWTFIFWGLLHGLGLSVQRLWEKTKIQLPKAVCWFLTFHFVVIAWIFFRAKTWQDATKLLTGMAGLSGFSLPVSLTVHLRSLQKMGVPFHKWYMEPSMIPALAILGVIALLIITVRSKNTDQLEQYFKPSLACLLILIVILSISLINLSRVSEFLYFNF